MPHRCQKAFRCCCWPPPHQETCPTPGPGPQARKALLAGAHLHGRAHQPRPPRPSPLAGCAWPRACSRGRIHHRRAGASPRVAVAPRRQRRRPPKKQVPALDWAARPQPEHRERQSQLHAQHCCPGALWPAVA
eukprot:5400230-Alexandrium_andersonii.AAC.1